MTIARDIRTGAVVGQVIDRQPGIRDECGRIVDARPQLLILDAHGYRAVPCSSVRLEEISDR